VAPLRLGGRRGKQSTSRVWLGGTGERSTVGERERLGAWDFDSGRGLHTRQDKDYGTLVNQF
jgi:hypothetical protein